MLICILILSIQGQCSLTLQTPGLTAEISGTGRKVFIDIGCNKGEWIDEIAHPAVLVTFSGHICQRVPQATAVRI